MDFTYRQLLQLVDRLRAQHGSRPFRVGGVSLDLDVAQQLCGFGLVELHADMAWPSARDLEFRAVPARGTAAPYRLVPLVAPGAEHSTAWTATLTDEAVKLAYRKVVRAPRRGLAPVRPLPRLYGRWPSQITLDEGGWGPEQVTVFEELAIVAPSGPRRRKLFGR